MVAVAPFTFEQFRQLGNSGDLVAFGFGGQLAENQLVGRGPGNEQLFAAGDRGDHILTGQAFDDPLLLVPDFYSENILYRFDCFSLSPLPTGRRNFFSDPGRVAQQNFVITDLN